MLRGDAYEVGVAGKLWLELLSSLLAINSALCGDVGKLRLYCLPFSLVENAETSSFSLFVECPFRNTATDVSKNTSVLTEESIARDVCEIVMFLTPFRSDFEVVW